MDTGADGTVVPLEAAGALQLPAVDEAWVEGFGGQSRRAIIHVARIQFAGFECLARVVALGDEAILGRDILNRVVLRLDGPALSLRIDLPRRAGRRGFRR